MSGHSAESLASEVGTGPGYPMIAKPFTATGLLGAVRDVLALE
jgi:hypothetical protein